MGTEERSVSITFTFKNGTGTKKQDAEGRLTINTQFLFRVNQIEMVESHT